MTQQINKHSKITKQANRPEAAGTFSLNKTSLGNELLYCNLLTLLLLLFWVLCMSFLGFRCKKNTNNNRKANRLEAAGIFSVENDLGE